MWRPSALINTPLQRGGWKYYGEANRFSGLQPLQRIARSVETAKAVSVLAPPASTPLKRGVNEKMG